MDPEFLSCSCSEDTLHDPFPNNVPRYFCQKIHKKITSSNWILISFHTLLFLHWRVSPFWLLHFRAGHYIGTLKDVQKKHIDDNFSTFCWKNQYLKWEFSIPSSSAEFFTAFEKAIGDVLKTPAGPPDWPVVSVCILVLLFLLLLLVRYFSMAIS